MSAQTNKGDGFDNSQSDNLYPDLSPADYENSAHIEQGQEPVASPDDVSEEQKKEWRDELEKVEGEIATLKQVLGSKVRYSTELKRKLGISPLQELKQDFQLGVKSIKDSETYQKTTAVAKSAADKTSAAVSSIVSTTSKKLGDIRNSQTFRSVEDKVGSAYASVKAKVSGSKSEGNFEEALLEESNKENATGGDVPKEKMPEEKVPL